MIKDIFVVHYRPLAERRAYLEEKLKDYNVTFVDQYERNTVDKDLVEKWYKKNEQLWKKRASSVYKTVPLYRDLSAAEICNALSHIYILDEIIKKKFPYAVVLEDDVVFKDGFFQKFEQYFNETPADFDIVFFGSSFTIKELEDAVIDPKRPIILQPEVHVYKKCDHPKTRTVDAYILTLEAAKRLRKIITEIVLPYDFDLAYFIYAENLAVYWWEPGIVEQGSMSGAYKSAIRNTINMPGVKNFIKKMLNLV